MIAYKKRIDFLENELAEAKLKILDLEQQLISSLGSTCKASPSYTDSYSQYDSFDIVRETPVIGERYFLVGYVPQEVCYTQLFRIAVM